MSWQVLVTSEQTGTDIESALREAQIAHRISVIGRSSVGESVGHVLDAGFRRVAFEGGDVQLAEAVAEVDARRLGRQTDFSLITAGTGSNLLRTFAAEQTLDGAIDRLVRHTPYPIDVGRIEGAFGERLFVNSVAAGVLAGGHRWFPWWPIPAFPARPVTIASGGTHFEAVASGALVMNGQFWGPWAIAPRSTVVDGVMDVQMFNGHRIALSRLRHSMRNGMHVRSHHVRRRSLADAEVSAPASWRVVVDGIRVGTGAFRVTCLPAAVRLAI
jgi:diacylglycerol kinase family enzyme